MKLRGLLSPRGCWSDCPAASRPTRSRTGLSGGQEARRTAQLFFGRNIGDKPGVTDADFARFMAEEVTPRFPDGLTVLDGGGQWRGEENKLIREASKLVLIVLPKGRDPQAGSTPCAAPTRRVSIRNRCCSSPSPPASRSEQPAKFEGPPERSGDPSAARGQLARGEPLQRRPRRCIPA